MCQVSLLFRTIISMQVFRLQLLASGESQAEPASPPRAADDPFYPKRLVRDVSDKSGYDYRVRPVADHNKPINVTIRMNLYQIVDVNERSQHVALYMWVEQMWRDEFLRWDPAQYGGISSVVIPYEKVWLPDTYLYNSLEMVRENTERWISIVLTMEPNKSESSLVAFRYPAIYRYTCNMDILYFPFDKQKCSMSFGSWMYDSAGIDYTPLTEHVIMSDFIPSEEWSVVSFTCKRELNYYKCCKVPFSVLVCELVLHRKPLHELVNLVVPTLIITLISFVGFFSPASTNGERTEKVNLGITTLLAMSILLLMVADQMPTTSNFVPLIGWFYLSVILLISAATVLTALIITVQKKGYYGHTVPRFARFVFFHCLAKFLRLKMPVKLMQCRKYYGPMREKSDTDMHIPLASAEISPSPDRSQYDNITPDTLSPRVTVGGSGSVSSRSSQHHKKLYLVKRSSVGGAAVEGDKSAATFVDFMAQQQQTQQNQVPPPEENLLGQVKHIQFQLSHLGDYIKSKEEHEIIQLEWEWLADVLDRCFLISFTFIALSVTFVICFIGVYVPQTL